MCLPVAGTLPASKSHKAGRRWAFLPAVHGRTLGTVIIVNDKRDTVSYGLAAEGGQLLFARTTGKAAVYGVSCDRAGKPVACTCEGFLFGRRKGVVCKHISCVAELLAEGIVTTTTALAKAHAGADLAGWF